MELHNSAPVLITGGARRIGLALARSFLQRDIPVIIAYRSTYPALSELKRLGATCIQGDFSTHEGIYSFAEQVRQTAPKLRAVIQGQAGADIIHLTDYVVEKGSDKHIAYAASKAALDNMTRSFARKLAPEVKVNAIAPALIIFNPGDDEHYRQQALAKSLMKIAPGESEVVNLVNYLLDSRYVTGRTHGVDGGRPLR
ncbi:MAG: dihydromonapterin reductase [Serratia liquefaciens]|nr:dihydromonapterin reductase [Serratia liquefaciens]